MYMAISMATGATGWDKMILNDTYISEHIAGELQL